MMAAFRPKRGDSWEFDCVRVDGSGDAIDLSLVDITASMRAGDDVYDFTVTKTDAVNGAFRLSMAPAVTETMIPSLHLADVQFAQAGDVDSSETFNIVVQEDITGAG